MEDQKLIEKNGHTIYTCLQPQFTIRKQSSRGDHIQVGRRSIEVERDQVAWSLDFRRPTHESSRESGCAGFWVAVLGKRPTQGQCRLVRILASETVGEPEIAVGIADVAVRDKEIVTQTDVAEIQIAPTQLDTQEGTFVPPSRRLVLIGGGSASRNRVNSLVETPVPGPEVFAMSGSDTESFGSVSSGAIQQWRWWSPNQMAKRKDRFRFIPSLGPKLQGRDWNLWMPWFCWRCGKSGPR